MTIILNSSIKQKVKTVTVFMAFALSFSACGGDSGSSSNAFDDGREVATLVDMGRCTSEREGDTVYVAEKMKDYLCKNRSWVDLSEIVDGEQSSSSDKKTTHSSSSATSNKSSAASVKSSSSSVAAAKSSSSSFVSSMSSATSSTSSLTSNVSSSSSSKAVSPQTFIRENISVTGVAQKGPFKFGSPLNLYELKNDLNQSGRVYKDEVNSNKGDFVIPKVNLVYPYAKLEVRGLYRNEVTGEWSKDSMTLRTLTDFSDKRTGTNLNDRVQVNINLLTHLEYDRALYLVQNKGYSVFAAKKQAAQEIMTAFEFATAVTYSEDFAIFQNEGVSAGTIAGNASLLAISALVMGNRSDTEIQSAIDKFREDIKTDGEWNDLQTKANMADWAYDIDYSKIRAAVKSWNILDIPDYETYLDIFWNNVYGLGGCSINRKDVVAPNGNKLSKYYNEYFVCKLNSTKYSWVQATTFEKDTYGWGSGKNGELKKGNVTDTIYAYNGTEWGIAEREMTIGLCTKSNASVVSKYENVYYICRENLWMEATAFEYDTYGWNAGAEGEVRSGSVNDSCHYIYENGKWKPLYGTLTDVRDGKTYKTIIIGSQTWMAENLNYAYTDVPYKFSNITFDSTSWYCSNISANYSKYGRLYTWAAAMDSTGVWSTNGKGCGYNKTCTMTYPVRGICPTGWHLPSLTEWNTLFTAVGGDSIAGTMLKSTIGWNDCNGKSCRGSGTDAYLFSVLPAGIWTLGCYSEGDISIFWSSTDDTDNRDVARSVELRKSDVNVRKSYDFKNYGFSVRCVKDSN